MRRWSALLIVMSLAVAGIALPATAVVVDLVLVYTGGSPINEGYTNFGVATGKTIVESSSLAELAQYDCVVLPANSSFNAEDLTALSSYVSAGGRLLALGEGEAFAGAITGMNAVAAALGSDMSLVPAGIGPSVDGVFPTTDIIYLSPFTAGVTSIRYAYTSYITFEVGPGPTVHRLIGVLDGESERTIIGVEQIEAGVFALSGDTNVFSDFSNGGYDSDSNGTLAANICDQATFTPNNPPVAEDDIAETEPGVSVNIAVLDNDTDADEDQLFVTNLTQPDNGSAVVQEDGTVTYTPNEGFSGDIDTFTYTASDGVSESDPATVTVGVFAGDVQFAIIPPNEEATLSTDSGPLGPTNTEDFVLFFPPGPGGPAFLVEIAKANVAACTVPGALPKPCVGNNQAQYYISSNATLTFEWFRAVFRGIKAGQVDFYKQNPDGQVLAPLPQCNKTQPKNDPPCEQKVDTLANGNVRGIVLAGPSTDDPIKGGYG